MKKETKPPTHANQKTGGYDMWENRQKALNSMSIEKDQTAEKLKNGHKFLTKDKTTKLIAPEKIESHLSDGWK